DRYFEETPRLIQHALAEQRASDLKHEVVVVTESEGQNTSAAPDRTRAIAELEQHLAKPRQRVFVLGVEAHGFLKCAARPHILLSREPRVSHAHMYLDGVGVAPQAFSQGLDRLVVLGFVVELMRAFVVVVGAQERFRHRTGLPGRLCYDTTPRPVTQARDADYLPRRWPTCPPPSRTSRPARSRRRAVSPPPPPSLPPRTALVLSTGVIGTALPLEQVANALRVAAGRLTPDGGPEAARAIMTTDTRPKHCAVRFETPAGMVTVGGIAKGAGMIHPDMATLLAVLTTDAVGEPAGLQ